MPARARRTSSPTSRPAGFRTAPRASPTATTRQPSRARAAAAWLPTFPKPWIATRAPRSGRPITPATSRVTTATPSPVASTRPAVPPRSSGLPVTIAGVWPCRRPYSSMSQAISAGPLPMSGAMMSRIGPSTFSRRSITARVARCRSAGERDLRVDVEPALGAAEGQPRQGRLPGHAGRERAHAVEVDVRVVAQAALVRARGRRCAARGRRSAGAGPRRPCAAAPGRRSRGRGGRAPGAGRRRGRPRRRPARRRR